jgi:hypothetical protein
MIFRLGMFKTSRRTFAPPRSVQRILWNRYDVPRTVANEVDALSLIDEALRVSKLQHPSFY